MDTNPSQPKPPHPDNAGRHSWLGRRKRIISRDVSPADPVGVDAVEKENHAAAGGSLHPADVIGNPGLRAARPGESILDPTLFTERQRRPGQNRVYHLTQAAIVLTLLAACGAIVGTLMEHRLRALAVAAVACVTGTISVKLVRSSRLAYRLRGYVAAACVLAMISMAACFFMPNFHRDADVLHPAPVAGKP